MKSYNNLNGKKLTKIVQIGCGHWGKNLTRNFAEIGALAGVIDRSPDLAKTMSETYGVPIFDFEECLSDPKIDGIAIATPATTHADLATKALNAGKHVYVEKPLALEVKDAESLISLAKKCSRHLMVGHLLQYHPVFINLLNHVRNGLVGEVQYIYSNRMSLGKFRAEENVLWSFAPHDFSMILAIVGQEPEVITAQGASFVTQGVADWCTVQFIFPSGVRGHIQTSWMHPFKEQRLVVTGSHGTLIFDDVEADWNKKLAFIKHQIDYGGNAPTAQKSDLEYFPIQRSEPLKDECKHFVDCIVKNKTPRSDGAEGLAVLKALSKAENSLQFSINVAEP